MSLNSAIPVQVFHAVGALREAVEKLVARCSLKIPIFFLLQVFVLFFFDVEVPQYTPNGQTFPKQLFFFPFF